MNIGILWLEVIWASIAFVVADPESSAIYTGLLTAMSGCVLIWITLARSSLGDHGELNPAGIYSLVRHPRILAEVMLFLGLTIASHRAWLFAFFLISAGTVVPLRIRDVEIFRNKKFGDAYRIYQSKVSTFFPQLVPANHLWPSSQIHPGRFRASHSPRQLMSSSALTSTYIVALSFLVMVIRLLNIGSIGTMIAGILAFGFMFYLVARIDRIATLREFTLSILNRLMSIFLRRKMRI